jgi:hypothetical protein
MSATESVAKAVTVITEVLDDAQKRRREEDAICNLFNEEICKEIDDTIGAGTASDLRNVVRNRIAAKARTCRGNSGNDIGDGLK